MIHKDDYLSHAEATGNRCIRYIEESYHPNPLVARSFAEEAAWYAFQACPDLRENYIPFD